MHLKSKVNTYLNSGSERSVIVKKNAIGAMLIKCGSLIIDFAKVPVLLMYLDAELYGVFVTITSMIYWTHQFDFGLGAGLRYQLTKSLSLNDKEKSKELVSTAYLSLSLVMTLIFLTGIPLIFIFDWESILNTHIVGNSELIVSIIAIFGAILLQFILELVSIVLQSDQKAAISTVFKPIANLLSIIVILVLGLVSHNSLLFASLGMILPLVLVLSLSNAFLFRNKYCDISPSLHYFRKKSIGEIYSMGLKYFIGSLSALIVFQTANFLISHYVNPTEAAVYNTAFIYFGILMYFNNMVLSPLTAAVTDAYTKKDMRWIFTCMKKINLYSMGLSVCSLLLLAVSQVFFHFWVGDRLQIPWSLSILLSIYFIMNIWVTPYTNFIGGVGKMNLFVLISIIKILVFIPVAIFFIKKFAAIGMVLTIIIVNTLPNIIFIPYQSFLIIKNKAYGIWNK